jgi:hypothetical protein
MRRLRSVTIAAAAGQCLEVSCKASHGEAAGRRATMLPSDSETGAQANRPLSSSDVFDAELLGPPRQELIEFRLGGPDNLVLQHLY